MKLHEILTAEKIDFAFYDGENLPNGPAVFVKMGEVIGKNRPFGFWVDKPDVISVKETQEAALNLIVQRYEKK